MAANFTTLTDNQRLEALKTIYKKGLCTSKEDLAFSADKLVYLKPFLTKLQIEVTDEVPNISSLAIIRQVVDELLMDIWEEIEATCFRVTEKRAEKMIADYGLQLKTVPFEASYYYASKVA